MTIYLESKATEDQIASMLEMYGQLIKIAVDIRRNILTGGGEMHADCKKLLLENDSEQDDIWVANWYLGCQLIEFEAIINIRPQLGNRSILIHDNKIREKVEYAARRIFEQTDDQP